VRFPRALRGTSPVVVGGITTTPTVLLRDRRRNPGVAADCGACSSFLFSCWRPRVDTIVLAGRRIEEARTARATAPFLLCLFFFGRYRSRRKP